MANDDGSKDGSKDDQEDDSEGPYSSGNDSTIDSTATIREKKNKNAKRNWKGRVEDFEVFPRRDEGPRSSNWLLFFYAIRLLVLKVFDLIIDLLAWLRGIIASSPSNQVRRPSIK
jgi:hypothetical protein